MDPLSISASIVALIQITKTTIDYLSDVKAGFEGQQKLYLEIKSAWYILNTLHDLSADDKLGEYWKRTLILLQEPIKQMTEALVALRDVLMPLTGFKRVGQAIQWSFRKEEVKTLLASIERHKSLFALAIQNDHIALTRAIDQQMKYLADSMDHIAVGVDRLQITQQAQQICMEAEERQKLLSWISTLDFWTKQNSIFSKRQEGTCAWFLEHETYQAYVDENHGTLWCSGIPGAGKTVLSAIVIDSLSQWASASTWVVACIYCDYNEQDLQTAEKIVASILQQVTRASDIICEEIQAAYRQHRAGISLLGLSQLTSLLRAQMRYTNKLYIIIDALDECNNIETRQRLIQALDNLEPRPNLLITSRHLPDIEGLLKGASKMVIEAKMVDIENYVVHRIIDDSRLHGLTRRSPDNAEAIVEAIIGKAQGMFLLARLQLDYLAVQTTPRKLREALRSLPETFDEMYSNVMLRIQAQDEQRRNQALRLLSWLVNAMRPLSIVETQQALSVEAGDEDLYEDGIPDKDMLISACAGLVTTEVAKQFDTTRVSLFQNNGIIKSDEAEGSMFVLTHYTAREFLSRTKVLSNIHTALAVACLRYMSFSAFQKSQKDDAAGRKHLHKKYEFLKYASSYWNHHVSLASEDDAVDVIVQFLQDEGRRRSIMSAYHQIYLHRNRFGLTVEPCLSALHVAAYFGLRKTATRLLDQGFLADARSEGITPLWLAVSQGQISVASILLEHGADPNAGQVAMVSSHQVSDMPIIMAALRSSDSMLFSAPRILAMSAEESKTYATCDGVLNMTVQLLLNKGADPEARRRKLDVGTHRTWKYEDRIYFSVLEWTCWNNQPSCLNLLIDKVIEIRGNYSDGSFLLALALESGMFGKGVGDALLSRKDIGLDLVKTWFMIAQRGTCASLRLLLGLGVDVSTANSFGETALHKVFENSEFRSIVPFLVHEGANMHRKDFTGRTPHQISADQGLEEDWWVPKPKSLILQPEGDEEADSKWSVTRQQWVKLLTGAVSQSLSAPDQGSSDNIFDVGKYARRCRLLDILK